MPETVSPSRWRLAGYGAKYARDRDPWRSRRVGSGRLRFARYARALEGVRVPRALEVGCAGGHFLSALSKAARRVDALDLSERALADAGRRAARLPGVSVRLANALTFKPRARYGLVAMLQVVSDFEPPVQRAFLRRAKALLRADGLLLCSTPSRPFALFDPERFLSWVAEDFEVLVFDEFSTRGRSSRWGHMVFLARLR
ncbi:MAG: class I SAM-dependent methyltransferase [Elusimicrobia bacterium]|nr:class I SAM-dependent methyltransferase [Elusimicrobiota bacterium]